MKKVQFSKYHGTGNDFIMIDERITCNHLSREQIKHLCDRHRGIGADGLILLQGTDPLNLRMMYYNSDGRESSMCGNGGRALTSFAFHLTGKTHFQFKAIDGMHESWVLENNPGHECLIKVGLTPVKSWNLISDTECFLDTGSPHHVSFVPDVEDLDIISIGRIIRDHEMYTPNGTNADFVSRVNETLFCRTYERGVEDETLSCGTGVTASALAANLIYGLPSPVRIKTPGGELIVSFSKHDEIFEDIYLTGPTIKVFDGQVNL